MSLFDDIYQATAAPLLRTVLQDDPGVTYISANGQIVLQDLPAIIRSDRFEWIVTSSGERRVRMRDVTLDATDVTQIQLKGRLVGLDGTEWLIDRIVERTPTFIHFECISRASFEQTAGEFRLES